MRVWACVGDRCATSPTWMHPDPRAALEGLDRRGRQVHVGRLVHEGIPAQMFRSTHCERPASYPLINLFFCDTRVIKSSTRERNSFRTGEVFALR